ncbi:MAG: pyridoxal phosphate-dependent aminotransferase [Kiritimatiellae bacterium]|nr:pyridoxal phosphate-dependent aminotransferase [Kiritimatiellia bacterium]
MKYDFDTFVSRRGTDCVKWDVLADNDILPLWVADMDFRSAPAILETLRRRVEHGFFGYALPPAAWRESLAHWLARRHGWKIAPSSILDSVSVIPAISAVVRTFCKPGEKVIIQTPVYNAFFPTIRNQGCEILENPLRCIPVHPGAKGDFTYEMDFEDLERKASDPAAKLFLISNPHNPAGRAWSEEELRTVGEICLRHGVFLASDEIHADLQLPGSRHVPLASLSDAFRDASVTFWSASKAFNLAGLQTAAIICADPAIRSRIHHTQVIHGTEHLNPFGFLAAMTAWEQCEDWLDELCPYLCDNYDAFLEFVHERIPGLRVATLEATYLTWVDASAWGIPSEELARRLEEKAKVKFSPGAIYGEPKGTTFLRVNLATPRSLLLAALERVERFAEAERRQ